MVRTPSEIAAEFALALDREDYARAGALLDRGCVYRVRGERHVGPDSIVQSYKGNGDEAGRRFDSIEYASAVRADGADTAVIGFTDDIRHGGRRLVHTCEQRVKIGPGGLIVGIEHVDLPGELERLERFKAECGFG